MLEQYMVITTSARSILLAKLVGKIHKHIYLEKPVQDNFSVRLLTDKLFSYPRKDDATFWLNVPKHC